MHFVALNTETDFPGAEEAKTGHWEKLGGRSLPERLGFSLKGWVVSGQDIMLLYFWVLF